MNLKFVFVAGHSVVERRIYNSSMSWIDKNQWSSVLYYHSVIGVDCSDILLLVRFYYVVFYFIE